MDVGDPGATLAGDGVAMAMRPLAREPYSNDDGAVASSGHDGGSTAAKGCCLANVFLVLAVVTFAANNSPHLGDRKDRSHHL